MKKIFSVMSVAAGLFLMGNEMVISGPAFESLMTAAGSDGELLPVVFDGAATAPVGGAHYVPFQPVNIVITVSERSQECMYMAPVPEPVGVGRVNPNSEKFSAPIITLDEAAELPYLNKGIAALEATASGKPLADFLKSEGVVVKWEMRGETGKEPAYARACPPEECGDKRVIYLNSTQIREHNVVIKDYKDFYLTSNPTFLAVVLAHELTHLRDYKNIGSSAQGKNSVNLFLELNGWSNETYVYHQLLDAGIAPTPNFPEEKPEVQEVRLHLAIRNYINGGKKPIASDFLSIIKDGKINIDEYIKEVTNIERKGSMSLAGVVENRYGLDPALENMAKPGFLDFEKKSQYNKYQKIREALGISTANYLKWKNPPPPPPPTPPVNPPKPPKPPKPPHEHNGGDNGGGNNDGGDQQLPGWVQPTIDSWNKVKQAPLIEKSKDSENNAAII